jgi:SAM-dependent methyltransferase
MFNLGEFLMSNIGASYSQIIDPKPYNEIMSKQHLYMALADQFAVNQIKELAPVSAEVVELGCGPARILSLISEIEGIHLTGVDLDTQFLDYARSVTTKPNVSIIQADVETYKHHKEVDIFCGHGVHHHIAKGIKTRNYLKNVFDSLKQGGYYILTDEFVPNYNNIKDREIKIVIWYAHIIAHAIKNNFSYLAQEETKTLLDDLFEGRTTKPIKSQKQIDLVLSKVGSIDEASRQNNLALATQLAEEFLVELETYHNLSLHGNAAIDLSRGDYKVCESVFRQEIEEVNFKVESVQSFGFIETIGAICVYTLQKGR